MVPPFDALPSIDHDAKRPSTRKLRCLSAWLFRHKGRADKASDFIKPPVEGSHSSSFPSVKILHEAWKPGLRFDGFPIEEPPYAPLAQDIYDRSVMKRVSVAWEITGDIAVFGQGGHVLLDGELLDPPSPIASSIKRPSDADIAIARHGLPDAQMIDSAILFEHPWETSFFDAFFFYYRGSFMHPRLESMPTFP